MQFTYQEDILTYFVHTVLIRSRSVLELLINGKCRKERYNAVIIIVSMKFKMTNVKRDI